MGQTSRPRFESNAPTVAVLGTLDDPVAVAIATVITALIADAKVIDPRNVVADDAIRAYIVPPTTIAAFRTADLLSGLSVCPGAAVLLEAGAGGPEVAELIATLTNGGAHLATRRPTRRYSFPRNQKGVWPFAGVDLEEDEARDVAAVKSSDVAARPLIRCEHGDVVLRCDVRGRHVVINGAEQWRGGVPLMLRRAVCPERFLDLLPALVFARSAAGDQSWKRPPPRATVIVDDPNLRRLRYGFLQFDEAARLAVSHNFHMSIGLIPLDHAITSDRVARLFRAHPDRLSIVMHGNDHLRHEFARPVTPERALHDVRQALLRMEDHARRSGVAFPRVMTFPHGRGSPLWIRALAHAGYVGAIARSSYSFTEDPGAFGASPLHELLPAELSIAGFPIVNRFRAEDAGPGLLFAAFLGKPVALYTHHDFFASGWPQLLETVATLNRHVAPAWVDAGEILRSNVMTVRRGDAAKFRLFTNDATLEIPPGVSVVQLDGRRTSGWADFELQLNGRPTQGGRTNAEPIPVEGPAVMRVKLTAPTLERVTDWRRRRVASRIRRAMTETRDRLEPAARRLRDGTR